MTISGENPVLELTDLSIRYGTFIALDSISLRVDRGDRIVLIGPSGSGKSTLIRCLNGFETPHAGTIRMFGRDITTDAAALLSARRRMSLIFQQLHLYSGRTALENVALGPRQLRGMSARDAKQVALDCLERVGVAAFASRYPFQLSGGQQQRVAIARALAMEPEVLLLDEPTSALDPELVRGALALLEEISADGMTIVCATHEMGFARRAANRMIFMCDGRIVEAGAPEDLFCRPHSPRLAAFLSEVDGSARGAAVG